MTPFTSLSHSGIIPLQNQMEGYLTVNQLSDCIGFRPATIRKWAREGKLLGKKIGDDWRFYSSTVMEGADMGRTKRGYKGPKNLIKRSDSPYWYICLPWVKKSTETEDLREAQILLEKEKLAHLEADRKPKGTLFSTVMEKYLREITPSKHSPRSDNTNVRKPLEFFSDKSVESIKPIDLYKYQEWRKSFNSERKKRPVSNATINREVALIKHALSKCVPWGILEHNPIRAGEVEGLGETKRERYITHDEFRDVLRCLSERAGLVEALYLTAQRCGRIFKLQWRQVDLEHRTITFSNPSSNKKAAEVVYINVPLLEILEELREARKKKAVISPYVFPGKNGKALTSIKTAWKAACKRAGIQDARIHDIRHKAITDMARVGIPKQIIQKAVGHSQGSTTERYTHLQAEDVREAFEALDKKILPILPDTPTVLDTEQG